MHYTTYWGVEKDRGLPKDPNWIQAIRVEPSDIRMEDWGRYAGSPGYWTRNQIVVNVKIIWTNPDKDTRWAGRTHCLPQTFGSKTDWEALRFKAHEMRLPDAFRFIRSAIGESQFEDYKVSARILPLDLYLRCPSWCDRFFEDELPMDIVTNTVTIGLKNQGVINVLTKPPTGDQVQEVHERVKYYKEPYRRNS